MANEGKKSSAASRKPDPLVLLREWSIKNKKVKYEEEVLEFGDVRVHKNAKCGFRLSPKEPLCDIGSIWFMFRKTSADESYTQIAAKKHKFKYIGVAQRADLCDYILGRQNEIPGLVMDVIQGRKRPREDVEVEPKKVSKTKMQDLPGGIGPLVSVEEVGKEISYQDVSERVRPVQDLDVLVRCPGRSVPNADLIIKIAQDEWKNWHKRTLKRKDEAGREAVGKSPFLNELEENLRKSLDNRPIILVPCNKNAPVNLLNVQELLQEGTYSKPNEERVRFFESTRPEKVEIHRNINGKVWTFEVRDSAKGFSRAQWYRTVCIITDGSDWQFKGFPFEDIVDMFTTIKGVYFQQAGTLVPLHVEKWSVEILQLAPFQLQHRFAQIRDKVFFFIETFMHSHRVRKFVNHTQLEGGRKILQKPLPIL